MGLKVVNVYRASLPQRYFPLLPPTSPWCRLLFYASIRPEAW